MKKIFLIFICCLFSNFNFKIFSVNADTLDNKDKKQFTSDKKTSISIPSIPIPSITTTNTDSKIETDAKKLSSDTESVKNVEKSLNDNLGDDVNFSGTRIGFGINVTYGSHKLGAAPVRNLFYFANKTQYSFILGHLFNIGRLYFGVQFDYNIVNNTSGFQFIRSPDRKIISILDNIMHFNFIGGIVPIKTLPMMTFLSLGVSWGHLDYRASSVATAYQSIWIAGITAGVGLEWYISKRFIFRMEYMNTSFFTNYTYNESNAKSFINLNTIRFSFFYKFNIF